MEAEEEEGRKRSRDQEGVGGGEEKNQESSKRYFHTPMICSPHLKHHRQGTNDLQRERVHCTCIIHVCV